MVKNPAYFSGGVPGGVALTEKVPLTPAQPEPSPPRKYGLAFSVPSPVPTRLAVRPVGTAETWAEAALPLPEVLRATSLT
jgi:hypothetical protein